MMLGQHVSQESKEYTELRRKAGSTVSQWTHILLKSALRERWSYAALAPPATPLPEDSHGAGWLHRRPPGPCSPPPTRRTGETLEEGHRATGDSGDGRVKGK